MTSPKAPLPIDLMIQQFLSSRALRMSQKRFFSELLPSIQTIYLQRGSKYANTTKKSTERLCNIKKSKDGGVVCLIVGCSNEYNKIMKEQKQASRQERVFDKSNCELLEFPVIKLHIFNDIEILKLSGNLISDLQSLSTHLSTSQHTLSRLKQVDLSLNQLPNTQSLLPLALAAQNLSVLKIDGNPFVHNLNFLYEIAVMFQALKTIQCGGSVRIDKDVRKMMVRQQLVGGKIMSGFLIAVRRRTKELSQGNFSHEDRQIIEGYIQQSCKEIAEITDKNNHMFQLIDKFASQYSSTSSSRGQTYRSPHSHRNQIQALSQYQITKQSNQQQRYLTSQMDKQVPLSHFYYSKLVLKPMISTKIKHQLEEEEEQNGNDQQQLLAGISRKWASQLELTQQFQPEMANHFTSSHLYSPLKSENTDFTSRVKGVPMMDSDAIYFALDNDWTHQTHRFVQQRLLSLIKVMEKLPNHKEEYHSPINSFKVNLPETYSPRDPSNNEVNYQTFGSQSFDLPQFKSRDREEGVLMSPKSKNKFIIGSLINILQGLIKKIVFRRLSTSRIIKEDEIYCLIHSCTKIIRRNQEIAIRKIFEAAIFYECLKEKMDLFKMKQVFKTWKAIKKRKLKILKSILNRKGKKQKAFMSVFLTQFRLNSRNLSLSHRLRDSKAEFMKGEDQMEELSCILKRSATCHKSLAINAKAKDTKLAATRRTFLKPYKLK